MVCLCRLGFLYAATGYKGADDAGSGVAHSNIGLCHGLMGDYPGAAKHHQEALRVALRVQVGVHFCGEIVLLFRLLAVSVSLSVTLVACARLLCVLHEPLQVRT